MTTREPRDPPATIDALGSATHTLGDLRLLYVGIATNLRRSASSTPRRTFAGLLLAEHRGRTVLIAQDAAQLTDWMHTHLHLTWCEYPDPLRSNRRLLPDGHRR